MVVRNYLFTVTLFFKSKIMPNMKYYKPRTFNLERIKKINLCHQKLCTFLFRNESKTEQIEQHGFKLIFSTPSMLTASLIVENLKRTEVGYFK